MHDPTSPKVAPLTEVLEEAKQAKETVTDAVDEMALIHTVLALELPAEVRQGDAGAAVEQTKDIEERLSDSAELLGCPAVYRSPAAESSWSHQGRSTRLRRSRHGT